MVLTVVVPMSRKSRDMGHPALGGVSTKNDGVRDLGHPPVLFVLGTTDSIVYRAPVFGFCND
jgi:hypothetical protein